MNDEQTLSYVRATSAALGLKPDTARDARVAMHLKITVGLAKLLEGTPLAAHDELAEIYKPAAFPAPDRQE